MKFKAQNKQILKELQQINLVISKNNTMPVLDCFLFEAKESVLNVTGTDLETTVNTKIHIQECDEPFKMAVPSKILVDLLKAINENEITFKYKDNQLEIATKEGSYKLYTMDETLFPNTQYIDEENIVILNSTTLSDIVYSSIFCASKDEIRPQMCGVCFDFTDGRLDIGATDAHRLAHLRYNLEDMKTIDSQIIIPTKPLNLLKNVINGKDVKVVINHNAKNASFVIGETTIITRLTEGKYPNYKAVIPANGNITATVNREKFISTINRVAIFSNESVKKIVLSFDDDTVNVMAENLDYNNKASEGTFCSLDGNRIKIGMNYTMILDVLNHIESEYVKLNMSEPNRAITIKGDDSNKLFLIMPLSLD